MSCCSNAHPTVQQRLQQPAQLYQQTPTQYCYMRSVQQAQQQQQQQFVTPAQYQQQQSNNAVMYRYSVPQQEQQQRLHSPSYPTLYPETFNNACRFQMPDDNNTVHHHASQSQLSPATTSYAYNPVATMLPRIGNQSTGSAHSLSDVTPPPPQQSNKRKRTNKRSNLNSTSI